MLAAISQTAPVHPVGSRNASDYFPGIYWLAALPGDASSGGRRCAGRNFRCYIRGLPGFSRLQLFYTSSTERIASRHYSVLVGFPNQQRLLDGGFSIADSGERSIWFVSG